MSDWVKGGLQPINVGIRSDLKFTSGDPDNKEKLI